MRAKPLASAGRCGKPRDRCNRFLLVLSYGGARCQEPCSIRRCSVAIASPGSLTNIRHRVLKPLSTRETSIRSNGRRPTVRDVARLAGVSVATVSRALSRPELVRDDKLDAVRAAADKLKYVVQGVGRALSSRRTNLIGALVPTLDHAMWAKTIFALQNVVAERGYTLALACSEFDRDGELALARGFIEHGADGIVLFGKSHKPELVQLLENVGMPYVSTWAFESASAAANVGFDNRKAATLVAEHLVGLGHRNIGLILGPAANEWQQERQHWLRKELERHRLPLRDDWLWQGPISFDTGRAGVPALLEGPVKPTAIICGHDILAVGAIAVCFEMGVAVPSQLSITGFEDLDLASNIVPPLTTVHFPANELGAVAGVEILRHIEGDATRGQIELPISLLVRGTTSVCRETSRASARVRRRA